jgi:hypothetical protein
MAEGGRLRDGFGGRYDQPRLFGADASDVERHVDIAGLLEHQRGGNVPAFAEWCIDADEHQMVAAKRECHAGAGWNDEAAINRTRHGFVQVARGEQRARPYNRAKPRKAMVQPIPAAGSKTCMWSGSIEAQTRIRAAATTAA